MYITKYSCVFLKLGERTLCIYVAMDLIPILLGSLPLAHNAQHSLVYIYIYKYVFMYVFIRSVYQISLISKCLYVNLFKRKATVICLLLRARFNCAGVGKSKSGEG